MSFALPYTVTIVNKSPLSKNITPIRDKTTTLWTIIERYHVFHQLVQIARMESLFKDPQTKATLLIPLDLSLPTTNLQACFGAVIQEKDVLSVNFETARTLVDSLIIPTVLSTTMMIQSGLTRYKTRDPLNALTVQTSHCVQFEPQTYNKPPFGIILNGKSRILTPDITTSNGLVHTIDTFPY